MTHPALMFAYKPALFLSTFVLAYKETASAFGAHPEKIKCLRV